MDKVKVIKWIDIVSITIVFIGLVCFVTNLGWPHFFWWVGLMGLSITTFTNAMTLNNDVSMRGMFMYKMLMVTTVVGLIGLLFLLNNIANWQTFTVAYTLGMLVCVVSSGVFGILPFEHTRWFDRIKVLLTLLGYYVALFTIYYF